MKACVMKIRELLAIELETGHESKDFFNKEINYFTIPQYQREYKWTDDKIRDLLNDTYTKKKFLGIIALEEIEKSYEVVDGQQRLSTILLILSQAFNFFKKNEEINRDQKKILDYMLSRDQKNHILINETIVSKENPTEDVFIIIDNIINIVIKEKNDIYKQKKHFERVYSNLEKMFEDLFTENDKVKRDEVNTYVDKLMNSTVLVFINGSRKDESIEEIYVDINDKSQKLDVEDIYKGYCFSKTNKADHSDLKIMWTEIKKLGFDFIEHFSYRGFSDFLYTYYLSHNKSSGITKKLEKNNEFILKRYTGDDIFDELSDMITYCKNAVEFYGRLDSKTYNFKDYCIDANEYKNCGQYGHLSLMSKYVLESGAQYHKLPFLLWLSKISGVNIPFKKFYEMITKFCMYSIVFNVVIEEKKKDKIEYDLISMIESSAYNSDLKFIDSIIEAVDKVIEKRLVETLSINKVIKSDSTMMFYSLIDNYDKSEKFVMNIYSNENDYTDEHFILHNNDKVNWLVNCDSTELSFKDSTNNEVKWNGKRKKISFNIEKEKFVNYKQRKDSIINHLVLPKGINGNLESYDIVTKIIMLEYYYTKNEMPVHVQTFFEIIKGFKGYEELIQLKESGSEDKVQISLAYLTFLTRYFEDEKNIEIDIHRGLSKSFAKKALSRESSIFSKYKRSDH